MEIQKRVLALFMSITVIFVCGFIGSAADEQATPKEEMVASRPQEGGESGEAVIGYLETRDQVIMIKAGLNGPLYTIKSREGRVIALDLTGEELGIRFPDLHERIEKSLADPKLWAGIDLSQCKQKVEVTSP